jgi:hypothetical protein
MKKPISKTPEALAAIRQLKSKLNTFHRTGNLGHWWEVQAAYQELHDTLHPVC